MQRQITVPLAPRCVRNSTNAQRPALEPAIGTVLSLTLRFDPGHGKTRALLGSEVPFTAILAGQVQMPPQGPAQAFVETVNHAVPASQPIGQEQTRNPGPPLLITEQFGCPILVAPGVGAARVGVLLGAPEPGLSDPEQARRVEGESNGSRF